MKSDFNVVSAEMETQRTNVNHFHWSSVEQRHDRSWLIRRVTMCCKSSRELSEAAQSSSYLRLPEKVRSLTSIASKELVLNPMYFQTLDLPRNFSKIFVPLPIIYFSVLYDNVSRGTLHLGKQIPCIFLVV